MVLPGASGLAVDMVLCVSRCAIFRTSLPLILLPLPVLLQVASSSGQSFPFPPRLPLSVVPMSLGKCLFLLASVSSFFSPSLSGLQASISMTACTTAGPLTVRATMARTTARDTTARTMAGTTMAEGATTAGPTTAGPTVGRSGYDGAYDGAGYDDEGCGRGWSGRDGGRGLIGKCH